MTAYVTLAEFKTWRTASPSALAGLDVDLAEDDALLTSCLESGARRVESICRRTFPVVVAETVATARSFNSANDGRYLFVDDFVGDIACTVDGTAVTVTVQPHRVDFPATYIKGGFGRNNEVIATAKWGWPALPEPVKTANYILGARFFELKGMPLGVLGQPEVGIMTGDAAERAAKDLLNDYRRRAGLGR